MASQSGTRGINIDSTVARAEHFRMPDADAGEEQADHYTLLGVGRAASPEQLRSAYRRLVLRCHPDISQAPASDELFKRIAEAYRELSDPQLRREYDQTLPPEPPAPVRTHVDRPYRARPREKVWVQPFRSHAPDGRYDVLHSVMAGLVLGAIAPCIAHGVRTARDGTHWLLATLIAALAYAITAALIVGAWATVLTLFPRPIRPIPPPQPCDPDDAFTTAEDVEPWVYEEESRILELMEQGRIREAVQGVRRLYRWPLHKARALVNELLGG